MSNFPKCLDTYLENERYFKDDVGCSEDEVYLFDNKYVLKVSLDKDRLEREKEKIDWLSQRISGPKSITLVEENGKHYYLRTCLDGDSLTSKRFLDNPLLLIETIKKFIEVLRKLDNENCPYNSLDNQGTSFVHGDLCLPNMYVDENNNFLGFIDLDNAGLGDKMYDYAWLLWSFRYNLKTTNYDKLLFEVLGVTITDEMFAHYIDTEHLESLNIRLGKK